jgi:hypothetical protein
MPSLLSTLGPLGCHPRRPGATGRRDTQPWRILEEAFIDGSFAPAKKGGEGVGKTKRGKGTKIMAVADGAGLPVAICAESATPHEVTLVQQTLAEFFVAEPIERLIGDNAYDSDRLDRELADAGVEMIAPPAAIEETERRTAAHCAATGAGGELNGSSHGCRTSAVSRPVGNTASTTFSGCFISHASSSC